MVGTTLSDRAAVSNEVTKADWGAVSGLNMIAARFRPGAISEGSSSHEAGDVPTRAVEPRDDAAGDGIAQVRKHDRDGQRLPLDGNGARGARVSR